MTTIEPEHAADLHEGENGDTAGPWTRVDTYHYDTGRWTERWWLVVTELDGDGSLWAARYDVGLTENQETTEPWYRPDAKPIPLVRVYPHEVVRIEYRTTPPAEAESDGAA